MLDYDTGTWGVAFAFTCEGSVIPKALTWAIPAMFFSVFLWWITCSWDITTQLFDGGGLVAELNISQVWAGYNFLIGFLLTFRTGKAYSRWWEGAGLLMQARGEWFNAFSTLMAFSVPAKATRASEVDRFQKMVATLMSHLFCAALNTVSQMEDCFEVINLAQINENSIEFLSQQEDKVELILGWIQLAIVEGVETGTLKMAPPLITRIYQELSRGVVNINEVRKISTFLFPFPYAQLTTVVLLIHTVFTPVFTVVLLKQWYWVGTYTFLSVFAFWSLNYVATELECPFGDDENDLPLIDMSENFNRHLLMALEPEAQEVPWKTQEYSENDNDQGPSPTLIKDFIRGGTQSSVAPAAAEMSWLHLKSVISSFRFTKRDVEIDLKELKEMPTIKRMNSKTFLPEWSRASRNDEMTWRSSEWEADPDQHNLYLKGGKLTPSMREADIQDQFSIVDSIASSTSFRSGRNHTDVVNANSNASSNSLRSGQMVSPTPIGQYSPSESRASTNTEEPQRSWFSPPSRRSIASNGSELISNGSGRRKLRSSNCGRIHT